MSQLSALGRSRLRSLMIAPNCRFKLVCCSFLRQSYSELSRSVCELGFSIYRLVRRPQPWPVHKRVFKHAPPLSRAAALAKGLTNTSASPSFGSDERRPSDRRSARIHDTSTADRHPNAGFGRSATAAWGSDGWWWPIEPAPLPIVQIARCRLGQPRCRTNVALEATESLPHRTDNFPCVAQS